MIMSALQVLSPAVATLSKQQEGYLEVDCDDEGGVSGHPI